MIGTGHPEMVQHVLLRPVLDAEHDIAEMLGKRWRDGFEHAPGDGFEIGDGGWVVHPHDIGVAVLRKKAVVEIAWLAMCRNNDFLGGLGVYEIIPGFLAALGRLLRLAK